MARFQRRFVKVLVPFTVLTTGLLPGSCALQFRDALITSTANFTANTFVGLLGSILNVSA